MVQYLFRKPQFPIICNIDGRLIAAKSLQALRKQLASIELREGSNYPLVDSSAEGWSLVVDHMVVSPLTIDKRWTKRKVIDMFNQSDNAKELSMAYSDKGLSAKRFDRILAEIVHILLNPNKAHEKYRALRLHC